MRAPPRAAHGVPVQISCNAIISAKLFPGDPMNYPTFTTVTPAGTLGYQPRVPGHCP